MFYHKPSVMLIPTNSVPENALQIWIAIMLRNSEHDSPFLIRLIFKTEIYITNLLEMIMPFLEDGNID